ncbi:hypothetical protein ACFL08_02210 [Patescibacteria group bacterium]
MEETIYYKEDFSFIKMIYPNNIEKISFQLVEIKPRRTRKLLLHHVTLKVGGCIEGTVQCLMKRSG